MMDRESSRREDPRPIGDPSRDPMDQHPVATSRIPLIRRENTGAGKRQPPARDRLQEPLAPSMPKGMRILSPGPLLAPRRYSDLPSSGSLDSYSRFTKEGVMRNLSIFNRGLRAR